MKKRTKAFKGNNKEIAFLNTNTQVLLTKFSLSNYGGVAEFQQNLCCMYMMSR